MMLSFGAAWPANIMKSMKTKTSKGKSLSFMFYIEIGYIFGIASKFVAGTVNYVVFFYVLNILMVGVDIVLYYRNRRLDQLAEAE